MEGVVTLVRSWKPGQTLLQVSLFSLDLTKKDLMRI